MLNFSESGHSVFRASSALERGHLKSIGKGKLSMTTENCGKVEADVEPGLAWDQTRNGTELTRTNRMETGIASLRT